MMEEFQKIFNFYKVEKTIHVVEDGLFMDIFNFFVSSDLDLEATILAENELEVSTERRVEHVDVIEEEFKTSDTDEVMEDVTTALHDYTLSKAEFFYLECKIKNPKDIWNEFTFIDNSNFDFSTTVNLLNQKSKNYFYLKKGKEMQ